MYTIIRDYTCTFLLFIEPLAPSPPRVVINSQEGEHHNFDVHLSRTSDKYGPIRYVHVHVAAYCHTKYFTCTCMGNVFCIPY